MDTISKDYATNKSPSDMPVSSVARLVYFYTNIMNFIHLDQAGDFFLASGSEPAFYIDARLRRTHIYLARYRSPGKDC